jgi:hypothetical protein
MQLAEAGGEVPVSGRVQRLAFKEQHVPLGERGSELRNRGVRQGSRRSRPVTSPPIAGVSGETAKPALGAFMAITSSVQAEAAWVGAFYLLSCLSN